MIRESFKDRVTFLVLGDNLRRGKYVKDPDSDLVAIEGILIEYDDRPGFLLFYFAENICCKIFINNVYFATGSGNSLKAQCRKQISWRFDVPFFSDGGLTEIHFKKLTKEQQKAYIKNMDIFT